MEIDVSTFLLKEGCGRLLNKESENGLFECLSSHGFHDGVENFQNIFKSFMRRDEEKMLFKSILQLLDNTGEVPMKSEQESDRDFNSRLEDCYQNIIMNCSNISPSSNFLQVYVFAIATLIGRPIYILYEDENEELSWLYFPWLYSHTFEDIRQNTNYTVQQYITMYFSQTRCFMIESCATVCQEPKSYGCLGLYKEGMKAILQKESITERCTRQISRQISLSSDSVQDYFHDNMSTEIRKECVSLYGDETDELDTEEAFFTKLLEDTNLKRCLYKFYVGHRDGLALWKAMGLDNDFLPLGFHDKLTKLEAIHLQLDVVATGVVEKCRTTIAELTERRSAVNKAVIGGAAAGIVGGGLTVAGLILIPFTFGASLGLTIAGASIGAAGGVAGGAARVVEGVKQNTCVNEIKSQQESIAVQENMFVSLIQEIEDMITSNSGRCLKHGVEGPGINLKGFLAVGSALRSMHSGLAIAFAALRVGATGATIAASVLGPLSLALDIGFLAEAAHNLRKGSKTGAGEILEQNAKAIQMKMAFFKCMIRGNRPNTEKIIQYPF